MTVPGPPPDPPHRTARRAPTDVPRQQSGKGTRATGLSETAWKEPPSYGCVRDRGPVRSQGLEGAAAGRGGEDFAGFGRVVPGMQPQPVRTTGAGR
jgi:hypothetical protein